MTSAARSDEKLPLPDFLADIEKDLEQGLLPAQIYNNRQIYELEARRIFARCWVFIGHETEIPNPGDYAARNIGEDPFIFVRGEDNVIRVLFNSCRHRGGQVYDRNGKREIDVPRGAAFPDKSAVWDELCIAVAIGRTPPHNGRWAKATMEASIAVLTSARERREVMLEHQVALIED